MLKKNPLQITVEVVSIKRVVEYPVESKISIATYNLKYNARCCTWGALRSCIAHRSRWDAPCVTSRSVRRRRCVLEDEHERRGCSKEKGRKKKRYAALKGPLLLRRASKRDRCSSLLVRAIVRVVHQINVRIPCATYTSDSVKLNGLSMYLMYADMPICCAETCFHESISHTFSYLIEDIEFCTLRNSDKS